MRRGGSSPVLVILAIVIGLCVVSQAWSNREMIFQTMTFILIFGFIARTAFHSMMGRK